RYAGMRIGSVAQLLMSDLVNTDGTLKDVVILRSKITKGKKTITAYFNHPVLRESLEKYLETRHSKRIDNVFVSQKGCAFSPNSLAQLMLRHYNRAGLEGCSSHSGRRTALTKLLKAGVDIVAVSKIAGHSSIATTQRYIHHDQDELLAAVANT
ncbi:MAG: site-specific integrase, partial [Bacteroidota bacterium]|nr:site-specific integrase [Bacteroidota bacterium]